MQHPAAIRPSLATRLRRCSFLVSACFGLSPAILLAQLDPGTWRIVAASSENVVTGEHARHAIDGDPETQWHTRWHAARDTEVALPPHSVTIDLMAEHPVHSVRYRSRAHGEGGLPKGFRLELSRDGQAWDLAAAGEFSFPGRMTPHAVIELEAPILASHLRLTVSSLHKSDRSREPGLVVAEIEVGTEGSPLLPTTITPIPQSREWNYGGYVWMRRHQDVLAYNATANAQLVFLGDSITHRWGARPFDSTVRTGQAVWEKYYGHRQATSLGYGWDRVENMLWRLRHGELSDTDPRLVVVMAGTNNIEVNTPSEIAAGVSVLCDEIHRQKPTATILLLAIFPRGGDASVQRRLTATNQRLSEIGDRPYVVFRDIGTAFLDEAGELTREVMPDLLHPGEEGYKRWAAAMEADVARILQDRPVASDTELGEGEE